MNCIDMMEIPELRETLNLRAGEERPDASDPLDILCGLFAMCKE